LALLRRSADGRFQSNPAVRQLLEIGSRGPGHWLGIDQAHLSKRTLARTQSATVPPSPIRSAVWGTATAGLTRASLQISILCDLDGVIDLDAEVTNGALDLRMASKSSTARKFPVRP
jgi:hypothetical protein